MKRINTANVAKEVPRGFSMELIFGQTAFALDEQEFALMHFNHQGVFSDANRAIAGG